MTWGGLWGAVAFYLALNIESEFKNQIITTTIAIIMFTIIGLGGTTIPVLKLLIKCWPQDDLLERPEDDADDSKSAYSWGLVSRLDTFSWDYLEYFLVRGPEQRIDPFLTQETEGDEDGAINFMSPERVQR